MSGNDSSFRSLRVMLDARLPAPAVIVASSALDGDGQDELAYGVARAFAEAGERTALISLYGTDGNRPQRQVGRRPAQLRRITFSIHGNRRNELNGLIAAARKDHDIVIVSSPPIVANSASLDLCRLADGVLLAVRLGRKITADDEHTTAQLKLVDAKLLGVIAMRPADSITPEASAATEALKRARFAATKILGIITRPRATAAAAKRLDPAAGGFHTLDKVFDALTKRQAIAEAAEQPALAAGGPQSLEQIEATSW
jgi:hypothetical protein